MKRLLSAFLLPLFLFSAAACSEDTAESNSSSLVSDVISEEPSAEDGSSDISSDSSVGSDSAQTQPADAVPNRIMASNGITGVFGVYDLDLLEPGDPLEDALIWSTKEGEGGDMKYREDTVFGDVIITCGSKFANIISYPEGKVLWRLDSPGNNPHSVEILPSGNVIVANSTGNSLRLFKTSALLTGDHGAANRFEEYELRNAHGVLYDPVYEVVWALGGNELVAYSVIGDGTAESLSRISGMGAVLPSDRAGGHDLSADYTDENFLYLTTNTTVFRFDKDAGMLIEKFPQYPKLTGSEIKGFSNNQNGNFFYSRVNKGIGTSWENENFASWCTDRIHFCYMKTENFMYVQEYVSQNGAFYKIRAFCGTYL